jgi:NADPH-dependent curcumin reductase CurA
MTRPTVNRQWRLASYPEGLPTASNWTLTEGAVPEPGPDQLLARAVYLDVAPYMRARVSPQKNYAAGVKPGEVMIGGGIGVVLESNSRHFGPGDLIVTDHGFGWQEYSALRASAVRKVEPALAPLPYWLDALGMNGMTAYFALTDAAAMRAGDTVVISAAAGSVGQIAGQIACIGGAHAVGITSSPEKQAWCREIGYAEVISYTEAPDLGSALARACPTGVDVFIDNTGGRIHDAVMQNLATGARIALVGTISLASRFGQPDIGQRFLRQTLIARATVKGFLVSDYQPSQTEARRRIAGWLRSGLLRSRFDIAEGIENVPDAFLRLLTSRNIGKQLVRVSEDPHGAPA